MKNKNITKNILEYTVIFEPAEEGGYVATVPVLDNITTEGDTYEETVEMVKDAITGVIEVMKENRIEIPVEKPDTFFRKISFNPSSYL